MRKCNACGREIKDIYQLCFGCERKRGSVIINLVIFYGYKASEAEAVAEKSYPHKSKG